MEALFNNFTMSGDIKLGVLQANPIVVEKIVNMISSKYASSRILEL